MKFQSAFYLLVLALFVLGALAGGEDISSCFEQAARRAETAASKNSNFFIPFDPFVFCILRLTHLESKPANQKIRESLIQTCVPF